MFNYKGSIITWDDKYPFGLFFSFMTSTLTIDSNLLTYNNGYNNDHSNGHYRQPDPNHDSIGPDHTQPFIQTLRQLYFHLNVLFGPDPFLERLLYRIGRNLLGVKASFQAVDFTQTLRCQ